MEGKGYRIERISPEAFPHLVTLMHRCFGARTSTERVRAKFNTLAFGAENIGFIAYADNGEPAAFYGVFPILVRVNGAIHLAAQSGDTMTDPAHQKKGLFVHLAQLTYQLAEANGIRFVFGFPNESSKPGFERRLHWNFSGHLQDFTFISSAFPLCELAQRFSMLRPLYSRLIEHRLKTLIDHSPSLSAEVPLNGCVRDRIFYAYKQSLGARWVTVQGIRLLVKPEVHLYVGDVQFVDAMDPYRLKNALLFTARRFLCRRVICTFSTTHPLYGFTSWVASPEEGLPIGHLDLGSGLPLGDLTYSRADLDTF